MSRTCTVCTHDEHHAINVALVHRDPYRAIASRYGLSKPALQRHSHEHLPKLLVESKHSLEVANADDLLAKVEELRCKAMEVLEKAEEASDHRVMLAAIDRASRQLELLARLLGEISDVPQINLHLHPEFVAVRTAIIQAVQPYPEARQAISRAMLELEDSNGAA